MKPWLTLAAAALLLPPLAARPASAQTAPQDIVLLGGHVFDAVRDVAVPNPGILIRAGKLLSVDGVGEGVDGARVITLADDEYVIPGMFDLHAHYAIDLYGGGRWDETEVYPQLFLANGVTSTFPAGELQPERMRELRLRIDRGEQPGPRVYNSGPYFGTARPGWRQDMTPEEIYADVDHWVEQGARAFKAKGIRPEHLKPLIERAHQHGLTVTGHLDSGFRESVNPRDAILMGIDRVEHFLGGDGMPATRSAYASYETMEPGTPEFERIARLYVERRVNFDATISAYGYYGEQDPRVYTQFTDEKRFLTPYARAWTEERPARSVNAQFERIYWVKQKEIKAFYDAGGADLITLGTDHPSWGDFFSPFSVHRELLVMVLAGIPEAAVLRIATINGARALGVGDRLGTIEAGKWADLVVVRGDPLADIRNVRNTRLVIKAGVAYDPEALTRAVEGRLGPTNDAEAAAWGRR